MCLLTRVPNGLSEFIVHFSTPFSQSMFLYKAIYGKMYKFIFVLDTNPKLSVHSYEAKMY